jgi:hypothetical protein
MIRHLYADYIIFFSLSLHNPVLLCRLLALNSSILFLFLFSFPCLIFLLIFG